MSADALHLSRIWRGIDFPFLGAKAQSKTGFAITACCLLVVNKLCMHELPLPSLICLVQLAGTVAFVVSLSGLGVVKIEPIKAHVVAAYAPWVVAFAATMYTSMMALQSTSVETVIVMRCLSPIILSVLEYIWLGTELPSVQSWGAMFVVISSATAFAWFEHLFRLSGMQAYPWVAAYVLCDVASTLLGRHLVSTNAKIPIWGHVLYSNLLSMPLMLLAGLLGGEHELASRFLPLTGSALAPLVLSCLLAVGISYFGWWARAELSAAAFSMLSVGTKVGSTALSLLIWQDRTSVGGVCALVVCLLASTFYRSPPRRVDQRLSGWACADLPAPWRRVLLCASALLVLVGWVLGSTFAVGPTHALLGVEGGNDRPGVEGGNDRPLRKLRPDQPADWAGPFIAEFRRRKEAEMKQATVHFPLASDTIDAPEVTASADALLTGKITMGARVIKFERELEAYLNVPCAVMVNSGSSANLVAVAGALELSGMNALGGTYRLSRGDEVLVPALAWSTTLAPLVQLGLQPILVDIVVGTLNIDVAAMAEKLTPRTRAIMLVHAMGNSPDMDALTVFAQKHQLLVIEDTCESLGSRHRGALLGTLGHFGSYSFYFSHHITSGEGGAVVSNIRDNGTVCETLRSVRAHGWTREFSPTRKAAVEAAHTDVDPRFLFTHWGFNVRPMETQAAIASIQLKRLEDLNSNRRKNFYTMKAELASHRRILTLPEASPGVDPAWFGLVLLLAAPYAHQRAKLFAHLGRHGVETRPVISGNFARQPVCNSKAVAWLGACGDAKSAFLPHADVLHTRGLYIGLPSARVMTRTETAELKNALTSFSFSPRHVTLVTGAGGLVGSAVRDVVASLPEDPSRTFVFASHADADLQDARATQRLLFDVRPTRIIHLAARIASTAEMRDAHAHYYTANVKINTNVLHSAAALLNSGLLGGAVAAHQGNRSMLRVVSCLSTAMLPANAGSDEPVDETAVMLSAQSREPVDQHVLGYASAKLHQLQLSSWLSKDTPGLTAVTLMPANVFGPGGKCDASGPLVNALIAKAIAAREDGTAMVVAGRGTPMRQPVFSEDLARVLLWAVNHYHDVDVPLIVAEKEIMVQNLAKMAADAVGFHGKLTNDATLPDGPLRRAVSKDRLVQLMRTLSWTPLQRAVSKTARACQDRHGATNATAKRGCGDKQRVAG